MSHRRNSPDHVHEADQPDMVLALFDADGLAGEDLAEVDLFVQKPHPTFSAGIQKARFGTQLDRQGNLCRS